ncbi:hypothetical protein IID23_04435 [Patescibacteria group bacterium]|nr:hypothetical protein [Patescibacteria group bacterium]
MSDSVPDEGTSPMEAPPPEQTAPVAENQPNVLFPSAPDIPKQSTFAEGAPKQEVTDRNKNEQRQQLVPEQQATTVEQPKSVSSEWIGPPVKQAQIQTSQKKSEPNITGMTDAPGLPSANQGKNSAGRQLSALGVLLASTRRALQAKVMKMLSRNRNTPERLGT